MTTDTQKGEDHGREGVHLEDTTARAEPIEAGDVRDTSGPEGMPGGAGVANAGGGVTSYMHSPEEDFALKGPSPKKKSRKEPAADGPREAVACAPRACEAPEKGDGATAAVDAENGGSAAPVSLRVWRLCKSPRVVLAKADSRDASEAPRRVRVLKVGVLRVGHTVHAVPADGGNWRQVRAAVRK